MAAQTLHTRRSFLRTAALGAAAAWTLPAFLDRTFFTLDALAADRAVQTPTGRDAPILVVLQLAGGNDGLNTLIPFADDAYRRARSTLALAADRTLKLNDALGLHPSLAPLKSLYDAGHLGIVQGVGYPNPNRSHFRSTEIWQTASEAQEYRATGWLGSYFDHACAGADPTVGVAIGGLAPQAFAARRPTGVNFARPEQFRWISRDRAADGAGASERIFRELNAPADFAEAGSSRDSDAGGSIGALGGLRGAGGGSSLDFLERTALDATLSSDQVLAIARRTKPLVRYPGGRLSESLSLVGRMIAGGLPTRVYYVSLGGFDTHQNQLGAHERLLGELAEATAAFAADLKAQGNFERVLLMTFSEFGRRVAQNASGGTDHGAAAPLFFMGGRIRPGLHGRAPSLTDLNQGDLKHTVDFRAVYAAVLEQWLGVPSAPILGRAFAAPRLVA
ncbi:MAG: DUF1501 domain-containing protein [Verrucomicrobia bacterium]|nr:DUF1501 domain-containing protein [Verrucomicrobiota bacterium]